MKEELFVLEKGFHLDTIYEYRGATLGLRTNRTLVCGQFHAYYKIFTTFLSFICPRVS